jgi:AAHS family benzoate transporter-like MFS transporter
LRTININRTIDESKFNRFHAQILFWCAFIIMFDGFDLVVYGTIVPVLMKEWHLTPIQAGTLGSYALFGMLLGALFFGPLADKIGRKNVFLSLAFSQPLLDGRKVLLNLGFIDLLQA